MLYTGTPGEKTQPGRRIQSGGPPDSDLFVPPLELAPLPLAGQRLERAGPLTGWVENRM